MPARIVGRIIAKDRTVKQVRLVSGDEAPIDGVIDIRQIKDSMVAECIRLGGLVIYNKCDETVRLNWRENGYVGLRVAPSTPAAPRPCTEERMRERQQQGQTETEEKQQRKPVAQARLL